MPPTTIRAHITQPLYILLQQPPRIVLYRHGRQLGSKTCYCFGWEGANLCARVDVKLGEDARRLLRPQGVKVLEGFLRWGELPG